MSLFSILFFSSLSLYGLLPVM